MEATFLKRLQNKLKNLKTKLEKIEAKEKRPPSELTPDEQNMLSSKPQVLKLIQEYEHLVATCPARDFAPAVAPEIRVETRVVDSAPEVLRLWLALHYVAQEGVKEAYLAQGLPLSDLEEALQTRKLALGQQEQPVKDVLAQASLLLTQFRKPSTLEEERRRDALMRVSAWALTQKVPFPRELTVATLCEVRQIVKEPETTTLQAPFEQVIPTATPAEVPHIPSQEAPQTVEETKEGGRWADEDEEEEHQATGEGHKEQQQTGNPEDADFVEVKGKQRKRKEQAAVPEVRESRGGRSRGARRGDWRPRGWHGQPPAPH